MDRRHLVKKRTKLLLLAVLAAVLMLSAGCTKGQKEEGGYKVYYVNDAGTRLMEEAYTPGAQTFEEMMEELLGQLSKPPSGYRSALPDKVKINGFERGIDALRIDFSGEYYDLSNTEEVLLRAAVVKTVSQIPGVTKIMITVDQQQLVDAQGKPVPAMDANTFIDTKEGGINSYQYTKLMLYFADKEKDQLVKEVRRLHYSSNMVLERVIVEQLIAGPEESGLRPLFTSDVKIENIYTQKNICTITLNDAANKAPSENPPDPETVLYAVVNSICETSDKIEGVRIQIAGDADAKFRGKIDLDQVFVADRSYIEVNEIETEHKKE